MRSETLKVALQPVVSLSRERIFGYEALARQGKSPVAPVHLFERAVENGTIAELELSVLRRSLAAAVRLLTTEHLFVNINPAALEHATFAKRVLALLDVHPFPAEQIIFEITEQAPFRNMDVAIANLHVLRARGARFALDDLGSGFSHLEYFDRIAPSFLKIGRGLGSAFECAAWRTSVVRNLQTFARETGCALVLEGIESGETADAARGLGIALGQGYYFREPKLADDYSRITALAFSSASFRPTATAAGRTHLSHG
ncbi:MAG TPA: EAL domain-containing protein [Thermoanaerobaculia bacterium]|jgi:EAL domain-containing protein (putative c-di-GMP-specific phosphodiesterase class I)